MITKVDVTTTHTYALANIQAGRANVIALTKDRQLTDCFNIAPYPAIGSALSQEVTYKREPCCLSCPHATLVKDADETTKDMYYQITCTGTPIQFKLSVPPKEEKKETEGTLIKM